MPTAHHNDPVSQTLKQKIKLMSPALIRPNGDSPGLFE